MTSACRVGFMQYAGQAGRRQPGLAPVKVGYAGQLGYWHGPRVADGLSKLVGRDYKEAGRAAGAPKIAEHCVNVGAVCQSVPIE